MSELSTASVPESRVLEGENPFGVVPDADLLAAPIHDRPLWSETMFFTVWDPQREAGVWLHMGVVPEDKSVWWAQTFALLPDGVVLVDRSFGRPRDERGPETGNVSVRCVEPQRRWTVAFDGAGVVSSTRELSERLVGAGVAAPFRFELELKAVVPVYDMHAAMGHEMDWEMGGLHHVQGLIATGSVTALSRTFELAGPAIRDHSRGDRDFTSFGGHVWNYAVWPESRRALCVFGMWSKAMEPTNAVAMVMDAGRTEVSADFDITGKSAPGGHPRELELRIAGPDGSRLELAGEVVHNLSLTYVEPNHNLNGTDGTDDALLGDESIVRWRWTDGEPGYGQYERGARGSMLPCTKIPLPEVSAFSGDRR